MTVDPRFRHSQLAVTGSSLHVVEAGDRDGSPFLFLHGWPQSWSTWRHVMSLASDHVRAIALDLPGVGRSTGDATDGSKREIATKVHELVSELGLEELTLVGQDVGGAVVFSYLRNHPGVSRAVMLDVVVPGVDPWNEVLRNPYLWHIAFHSIPVLPEQLVQGRQREYFDFFYDVLSTDPGNITDEAREEYAQAYSSDAALTAGFNWYRAFSTDAHQARERVEVSTPVLYLRGEKGAGTMADYVTGLASAGLTNLTADVVPGGGHFVHEEAPVETWRQIAAFAGL
jgi:pimeloyl-ACP methyl ester carboxylesterase